MVRSQTATAVGGSPGPVPMDPNATIFTNPADDLWSLVRGAPFINAGRLFIAVVHSLQSDSADFRTRLLLRDAMTALQHRWGATEFQSRLLPTVREMAQRIAREDLGEPRFRTLEHRMASATDPQIILPFLRELGMAIHTRTRLEIGGATALILAGLLHRGTEAIDAVNEIPAAVRIEHALLDQLANSYGLRLAHFQSHYLPTG